MRNHLILLLSCTAMLGACGSINDSNVSADDIFEMMDGPEVSGVDSTMQRIGTEAEKSGQFAQAAQHYQQLLDKDPTNTNYAIRYGENLRKSGERQKALAVFQSVLTRAPNNVDALEGKGLTLLALADTENAGLTLNRVMQIAPNRWRTLNAVGVLFTTKAMYQQALQYFDESLKFEPNHPATLNNKGLTLALAGAYPQALQTLFAASKHARLPIQQSQADLNAALVYAIAGDTAQAQTMASRHLEGASLQNNLGLYALMASDQELAKTHLNMALLESKTFYEKAWNNLEILKSPNAAANSSKRVVIDSNGQPQYAPASHLPSPPDAGYNASTSSN